MTEPLYVPATEETDPKKQNRSLQGLGGQIASYEASWSVYSPTVTASSGTITSYTATGRYKKIGRTVFVQADVSIVNVGTAVGQVIITLPFTSAAFWFMGLSREIGVSDKLGSAAVPPSTNTAFAIDYSATTFLASGKRVVISVTYETP